MGKPKPKVSNGFKLWAFGRVNYGLTLDEFKSLTIYELEWLNKVYLDKRDADNHKLATLMCVIVRALGGNKECTPEDFLPQSKKKEVSVDLFDALKSMAKKA